MGLGLLFRLVVVGEEGMVGEDMRVEEDRVIRGMVVAMVDRRIRWGVMAAEDRLIRLMEVMAAEDRLIRMEDTAAVEDKVLSIRDTVVRTQCLLPFLLDSVVVVKTRCPLLLFQRALAAEAAVVIRSLATIL